MTKVDLHYTEPRLVELYDIENPRGADTDFYLALADEFEARTIVDVGCGTGLLTRELAVEGRRVVGVDPAPAMLRVAHRRPGAGAVQWVEGDSSTVGTPDADLVVMTGNVPQVFLDDADWAKTLSDIHAALRPGGHLAFESRNPADRPWERWDRTATCERLDSPNGPVESWLEVVSVEDGLVRLEGHNVFLATGEVLVAPSALRFRDLEELTQSLTKAGFIIEEAYGDWDRSPISETCPLLILVARRVEH